MDEFELIRRFFTRASADPDVLIGVGDDGAVLRPAPGRDLVQVVDTLVEGIHYPAGLAPVDVGFRAVAVNLSDIAAMGARPRWMTLALTLSEADPDWLAGFADGMFLAAGVHGVELVGGDTTHGPRTVISVNLTGDVEPGRALTRAGARDGDLVFVSGRTGDAAAGLGLIQRGVALTADAARLQERFRRPVARIELGARLGGLATAAIDVSDGLYGDVGKLLAASRVGGRIELERLPVSPELVAVAGQAGARELALAGGDDYELCFTAPGVAETEISDIASELRVPLTRIGTVVEGSGVTCTERGTEVEYRHSGYLHFGDST